MKNIILLLVLATSSLMSSQGSKTCSTPEESLIDLNSIAKCSVKSSTKESKDKKSRQITVKVSASKKRYLKKRKIIQKKSVASSANNLNVAGISETGHSSGIDNSLSTGIDNSSLANEKNNINSVAHLTNSLSAEEVRKANKFSTIDKIPAFNACKNAKKKDQLDCFNTEMIKHIQKHFNYPASAVVNKIEGEVWVRFIIDKDGHVANIKAMGPQGGEILDGEAIRVVTKLDRFIPGEKDGETTPVKYGFPIAFSLED